MYQPITHLVRKYRSYDTLIKTHDEQFEGTKIILVNTTHNMKFLKYMYYINSCRYTATELEYSFRESCYSGYLDAAQWLHTLYDKTNIHIGYDYVFMRCCTNGHLDVAQWLYSLDGKINIHACNDCTFRWSCSNGHLDVAQWLYSLDNTMINELEDNTYPCNIEEWFASVKKTKT